MAHEKYILVTHFCEQTRIEYTFVNSLHEYGLVTFEEKQNDFFMDENDISEVEKMFRLHNDLGINLEGLGVVKQMLKRIRKMEDQMALLQQQLHLYE